MSDEKTKVRIGDCLPIRKPASYCVPNNDQFFDQFINKLMEIAMPEVKVTTTKQPLKVQIIQGENGYMVAERSGDFLNGRTWFALTEDQLGKLLVKLAKASSPISKV